MDLDSSLLCALDTDVRSVTHSQALPAAVTGPITTSLETLDSTVMTDIFHRVNTRHRESASAVGTPQGLQLLDLAAQAFHTGVSQPADLGGGHTEKSCGGVVRPAYSKNQPVAEHGRYPSAMCAPAPVIVEEALVVQSSLVAWLQRPTGTFFSRQYYAHINNIALISFRW